MSDPLDLKCLLVTQPALRFAEQVAAMAEYVRGGGCFDEAALSAYAAQHGQEKASPLVQVNIFDDAQIGIMDGHHRCVGLWEGGRHLLYPEEFRVHHLTYNDFVDIVFDKGWVTPYDPRTHVRIPELDIFKSTVKYLLKKYGEEYTERFIRTETKYYRTPRTISTVEDLHQVWSEEVAG
jgi:hypothetical protein